MMMIKNNIIYSFVFGSFILIYIFWNRLLRKRELKTISDNHSIFDLEFQLVMLSAIIFFILLLYYTIKLVKPNNSNRLKFIYDYINDSPRLTASLLFVSEHVLNGPSNIYNYFYERIYLRKVLESLGGLLYNWLDEEYKWLIFYLLFFVVPRIFVVVIFVLEVIYFRQINYFYKFLPILLIPMCTRALFYMAKYHVTSCMDYYHYYFIIKIDTNDKLHVTYKKFTDPIDVAEQEKFDINYMCSWWEFYQYVFNIISQIELKVSTYKYHVNILNYGLYLIGFSSYALILIGLL